MATVSLTQQIRATQRLIDLKQHVTDDVIVSRSIFPDMDVLKSRLEDLKLKQNEEIIPANGDKKQKKKKTSTIDLSILDKYRVKPRFPNKKNSANEEMSDDQDDGEPPGFMVRFSLEHAYQAIERQEEVISRPKLKPYSRQQRIHTHYFDRRTRKWKIIKQKKYPDGKTRDKSLNSTKPDWSRDQNVRHSNKHSNEIRNKMERTSRKPKQPIKNAKSKQTSLGHESTGAKRKNVSFSKKKAIIVGDQRPAETEPAKVEELEWLQPTHSDQKIPTVAAEKKMLYREKTEPILRQRSRSSSDQTGLTQSETGLSREYSALSLMSSTETAFPEGSVQFSEDDFSKTPTTDVSFDIESEAGSVYSIERSEPISHLEGQQNAQSRNVSLGNKRSKSPVKTDKGSAKSVRNDVGDNINSPQIADEDDEEEFQYTICSYLYKLRHCKTLLDPTPLLAKKRRHPAVGIIDITSWHEEAEGDCPYCVTAPQARVNNWLESLRTGDISGVYAGYAGASYKPVALRKSRRKRDIPVTSLSPILELRPR